MPGSENFRYPYAAPLQLVRWARNQPRMLDWVCLSILNCWNGPNWLGSRSSVRLLG